MFDANWNANERMENWNAVSMKVCQICHNRLRDLKSWRSVPYRFTFPKPNPLYLIRVQNLGGNCQTNTASVHTLLVTF